VTLIIDYDRPADMLYLHIDKPRAAVGEVDDRGVILRSAIDNKEACGVAVPWFKDWEEDHEDLANRISTFLSLPKSEVLLTISSINTRESSALPLKGRQENG